MREISCLPRIKIILIFSNYPENGTWTLEAGKEMNFIISNYHPDGWWDHVEWRCDDSQNVEKLVTSVRKGM